MQILAKPAAGLEVEDSLVPSFIVRYLHGTVLKQNAMNYINAHIHVNLTRTFETQEVFL